MARISLLGGYYQSRSLIAGCQRCLNLIPEANQKGSGAPDFTDYSAPGLTLLGTPPVAGAGRGLFTDPAGNLYAVIGATLYSVSPAWAFTALGTLGTSTGHVSAVCIVSDMVISDGSRVGYDLNLSTQALTTLDASKNFYGSVRMDSLDTYILGNIPGTNTFFSSYLNTVTFDPLYQANKSGEPDTLVAVVVVNLQILLIGQTSTEIWFDAGSADFPFQRMQGPFIQYGCQAPASIDHIGSDTFFLGQDKNGGCMVMMIRGYAASRISTHAIENQLRQYSTVSDAIGFCYEQEGHQFYMLSFPTADATWCYDVQTGLWHERAWLDTNGGEHRHRAACHAFAYGQNIVTDWETGALYALDLDNYTDNGQPILRVRDYEHLVDDGKRVIFSQFIVDMEVGGSVGTTPAVDPSAIDASPGGWGSEIVVSTPATPGTAPQVSLRWSDDRGVTFGNAVILSAGATGQYLTSMQAQRLGMARDRVFEISWSEPIKTAIQGAFIETKKLGS